MTMFDYRLEESVAVLTMHADENRFNPDFLSNLMDMLDTIENQTEAKTLVVASAHEKIFSNGIDLNWLVPVIQNGDLEGAKGFFNQLNELFKRMLTYPMITVAAMGGHVFAGGAIWSCTFDFRFMRSDRGYFCLPEVDLGIPFLPGMNAILRKAVSGPVLEAMQLTGVRFTAETCQRHQIVRKACDQSELMGTTLEFAKALNKSRNIVTEMKKRNHKSILDVIEKQDPAFIDSGQFHIG